MKILRYIFCCAFILVCATAFGQLKTVAVGLVDKNGNIDYEIKLKLRTSLTKAISQKQGYSAVDRDDISSILSEQQFQQSGLVDSETIKRLGAMTGAKLILRAEALKTNDKDIYVVVKLLDVETARIRMTEDITLSISNIESGCNDLANKVLGISNSAANKPVKLYGYLTVYPKDIGSFTMQPNGVIAHLNNTVSYGYNGWRLPTDEELSVMRSAAEQIPDFQNSRYMTSSISSYEYPTLVRLVTTGASAEELRKIEEEKEKKRIHEIKKSGKGVNGVYEVGDYYHVNNKEGIVLQVSSDGKHGLIVSVDQIRTSWREAQRWCELHGEGWHLPTLYELSLLANGYTKINNYLKTEQLMLLGEGDNKYWSSKGDSFGTARITYIGGTRNGQSILEERSYYHNVRAVCAF